MARIAGVNIPTNKLVVIGLTYIYGIGRKKAEEICTKVGIPANKRVSDLTDDETLKIRELIDSSYHVEGDLRREVSLNIKRLMDIGCFCVLNVIVVINLLSLYTFAVTDRIYSTHLFKTKLYL